jgi:hypothetical protein
LELEGMTQDDVPDSSGTEVVKCKEKLRGLIDEEYASTKASNFQESLQASERAVEELHQVALLEAGISNENQQDAASDAGDRALELGLLNYRNALQHMSATYLSQGLGPAQHQVLAAYLSSNAVSSLVKWGTSVGETQRTGMASLQKRVDDMSTDCAAHKARTETVELTAKNQVQNVQEALKAVHSESAKEHALLRERLDDRKIEVERMAHSVKLVTQSFEGKERQTKRELEGRYVEGPPTFLHQAIFLGSSLPSAQPCD